MFHFYDHDTDLATYREIQQQPDHITSHWFTCLITKFKRSKRMLDVTISIKYGVCFYCFFISGIWKSLKFLKYSILRSIIFYRGEIFFSVCWRMKRIFNKFFLCTIFLCQLFSRFPLDSLVLFGFLVRFLLSIACLVCFLLHFWLIQILVLAKCFHRRVLFVFAKWDRRTTKPTQCADSSASISTSKCFFFHCNPFPCLHPTS